MRPWARLKRLEKVQRQADDAQQPITIEVIEVYEVDGDNSRLLDRIDLRRPKVIARIGPNVDYDRI